MTHQIAQITIPNGASASGALNLNGGVIAFVIPPAALDGTKLRLQVSADGLTFIDADNSGAIEFTFAATKGWMPAGQRIAGGFIRFVALDAGNVAQNQTAARVLNVCSTI